jgi:hypothetical protein
MVTVLPCIAAAEAMSVRKDCIIRYFLRHLPLFLKFQKEFR